MTLQLLHFAKLPLNARQNNLLATNNSKYKNI
jgi:hypothetical protein